MHDPYVVQLSSSCSTGTRIDTNNTKIQYPEKCVFAAVPGYPGTSTVFYTIFIRAQIVMPSLPICSGTE
eukprot:SAG11_NODE_1357_length_5120_cov_2.888668_7_plen_69_part_00